MNEGHDVGIVGTFDVENYGDLLFPLMARDALAQRNASVRVVPFAPSAKSEAVWPYEVRSTTELHGRLSRLSALLIGGGQIIRFDGAYPIPVDPGVTLPIDYWLAPAVSATLLGKPVFWNAVGAWTLSPVAPWYDGIVEQAFLASRFVGVRDQVSINHLRRTSPRADFQFLPDTVFSISRLWPLGLESDGFAKWRSAHGIAGRYVVVQADVSLVEWMPQIKYIARLLGDVSIVAVPICWCHGDRSNAFRGIEGFVESPAWLSPQLISEILGRAQFVVASSLHACIAALGYGVPVARVSSWNVGDRKFEMLAAFDGIATLNDEDKVESLVDRGRHVDLIATEYADRLDRYWDDMVAQLERQADGPSNAMVSFALDWAAGLFRQAESMSSGWAEDETES